MQNNFGFLIKILVLSAAIAIAIKSLAPLLPIPARSDLALALVLAPSVVLFGLLQWRSQHAKPTTPD